MKSSLGLKDFTFVCEVNLRGLRPFNQWELLDCNGNGPSVLCVMWPSVLGSKNQGAKWWAQNHMVSVPICKGYQIVGLIIAKLQGELSIVNNQTH